MKRQWIARIHHKNKNADKMFSNELDIIGDNCREVLQQLLLMKDRAFFEIEEIVIKRLTKA